MKRVLVLMAIVLMAGAVAAQAAVINPLNSRPVIVGSTTDPASSCSMLGVADCQLQTLVNYLNPGSTINVNTDQQIAGMWALGGVNPVAAPVLGLKIAGDAFYTSMGIWSGTDTSAINMVTIFNAGATGGNNGGATYASLMFKPNGDIAIGDPYGAGTINVGTFSGINRYGFGFYITDTHNGNTFYSVDQLNGDSAQMLAFRDTAANRWTMGFEDTLYKSGDHDFNDLLFQIESITPVPEPGSMLLLGTGLFGLAGAIRRRMKK